MFDIQELNDMVFNLLGPQELAQCVRVNKKWHTAFTPYLWGDLSWLDAASIDQKLVFGALLQESYHREQQQREMWDLELGLDHLEHSRSSHLPPVLAKYGPCIRVLPDLIYYLQLPGLSEQLVEQSEEPREQNTRPNGQELLLHILKNCHGAQLSFFYLDYDKCGSDNAENAIAELLLPHVRRLSVQATYSGKRGELWKLKRLLGRCSTTLEKLTIQIDYRYGDQWSSYVEYDEDFNTEEEDPDTTSSTGWSSLKELVLYPRECVGTLQPTTFWSWFYKRCGQVERVGVSKFRRGTSEDIAKDISEHMPNLNEITIGDGHYGGSTIKPDRIASLLSGSRNGWKVVNLKCPVRLMPYSVDDIRKHFPTLEVFHMERPCRFDLSGIVEILSSSPNLHTLCGDSYHDDPKEFIDQDPNTRALKVWACETSLKVLKVKIGAIPRPEFKRDFLTEEEYPGQGREIQGLVYDRLARLTNLETLSLVDAPEDVPKHRLYEVRTQFDCLEMSLESGLHKLSKLRKLKELNVLCLKTRIGVKEAQWMTEHWPRLRVLRGLDESDDIDAKEAVQWLRKHRPEIEL